jgi:hypothetical protein
MSRFRASVTGSVAFNHVLKCDISFECLVLLLERTIRDDTIQHSTSARMYCTYEGIKQAPTIEGYRRLATVRYSSYDSIAHL